MATGGIGAAKDYFRLRVTRLTQADAPEFEWREDILYREPPGMADDVESTYHRVEVVALDDDERVVAIGVFESIQDASEASETAAEDLESLTRSEFEERYFPAR
jgi:hypothetical protein